MASEMMTPALKNLQERLIDYGNSLRTHSENTEELLKKLDALELQLSRTGNATWRLVEEALRPAKGALMATDLLRHVDVDVKVSVASCISQIIRITSPEEPFDEHQMEIFFQLANTAYGNLANMTGRAYSKACKILRTVSYVRACVLMVDLDLYDPIKEMFELFFNGIRASHPEAIFSSMENIMTSILLHTEDCKDFARELIVILTGCLKKEYYDVSPVSFNLAKKVCENCADYIKANLPDFRLSRVPVEQYDDIVASLFQDTTQRENMDTLEIGVGVTRREEGAQVIDGGLPVLVDDHRTADLERNKNVIESHCTSPGRDEPEYLDSPINEQPDITPKDAPILSKRIRKPNSLTKPEEGYRHLRIFSPPTPINDSHCLTEKRKEKDVPLSILTSNELQSSTRPAFEQSNSQRTDTIPKLAGKRRRSMTEMHVPKKHKSKTTVSKNLKGNITFRTSTSQARTLSTEREAQSEQKHSAERRRRWNNVAPVENSRSEIIIAEDMTGDILIKSLSAKSRRTLPKEKTQSGKSSNQERKWQSMTSKQKDTVEIGVCVTRHEEDAQVMHDGLPELAEDNRTVDLETNENLVENHDASPFRDEPEHLSSPCNEQPESEPEDAPISSKRIRKPNSLMKQEEGYKHLRIFSATASMNNTHCIKETTKRNDIQSSSRHADQQSNPQKTGTTTMKHATERARSLTEIPIPKIHKKREAESGEVSGLQHQNKSIIANEEKCSAERGRPRSKGASAEIRRGKITNAEDITGDILIKSLASKSRRKSSDEKA